MPDFTAKAHQTQFWLATLQQTALRNSQRS